MRRLAENWSPRAVASWLLFAATVLGAVVLAADLGAWPKRIFGLLVVLGVVFAVSAGAAALRRATTGGGRTLHGEAGAGGQPGEEA